MRGSAAKIQVLVMLLASCATEDEFISASVCSSVKWDTFGPQHTGNLTSVNSSNSVCELSLTRVSPQEPYKAGLQLFFTDDDVEFAG